MRQRIGFSTWFFLGAAVLAVGCSRSVPGPATLNVTGKIVVARGPDAADLFNRDGAVEFQSIDQPGVRAYGEIQPDGSFKLVTSKDGASKNGIVEGQHRVRLLLDEQAANMIAPEFLKFETSGLTAQISGEQELVLEVWR